MRIIYRDPGFIATRGDESVDDLGGVSIGASRPTLALGDWIETWAKPIGCVIDRCTARLPVWLVAPKPFRGIRLSRPTPKPKRWSWAWLADRIARATINWPAWATKPRHLPHTFRTGFCRGTCGCNKRRQFLNQLLPDMRFTAARSRLAARLKSFFRTVYRPPSIPPV